MNDQNMYEEKPVIDLLPQLPKRCILLVHALHALFIFVPVLLGWWAWSEFGWLYGLLVWLAALFAGMIVISKLKLAYIPFDQHELSHSTTAILKWVVYRKFC